MPKGIPKNGINKGWFKKTRKLERFKCKFCKKSFVGFKGRVFCSKQCHDEYARNNPSWNKGKPAPWAKNSPNLFKKDGIPWNIGIAHLGKGEDHPHWKGGKPKCLECGKQLDTYGSIRCQKCYLKIMKGENAPNWKGGLDSVVLRRARIKDLGGFHMQAEWEDLKKKYNYMCLCCKRFEPEIKLTKDHIIPTVVWKEYVKGKKLNYDFNDIKNIQPLCIECNTRKFTKIINFKEQYECVQ